MVSRRYRSKNSVGTRITELDSKVQRAEQTSGLDTDEVTSDNLAENSVGPEAIAPNAVGSDAIARGAVGTENLGVVNTITPDSDLLFDTRNDSRVKLGPNYYPDPGGETVPLMMNDRNQVVTGANYTLSGIIINTYTSGPVPVLLDSGDVVPAVVPFDMPSLTPGSRVIMSNVYGVFYIVQVYSSTTSPKYAQRMLLSGQNGWGRYHPVTVPNAQSFSPVTVSKSEDGYVVVQGIFGGASPTGTSLTVITTLPDGFRPPVTMYFPAVTTNNTYVTLRVSTNGFVQPMTSIPSGAGAFVSLANIVFRQDAGTPITGFANGWSSNAISPLVYGVDSYGVGWLRGLVEGGTNTTSTKIADNPPGMAPLTTVHAPSAGTSAFSGVGVQTGAEQIAIKSSGVPNNFISLQYATPASTSKLTWAELASTYQNSWVDYNAPTFPSVAATIRLDGMVMLRGFMRSGSLGTVAFVLPEGYRPAWRIIRANNQNGSFGRIDIYPDGSVIVGAGATNWVTLDNIMFHAGGFGQQTEIYTYPLG